MTREELIEFLYNLCSLRIDYFNRKEFLALETMDIDRCPLSMADSRLYDEMQAVIDEYCEEEGIDTEEMELDAESVFIGY